MPTVMFWNPDHWEIRDFAKQYFEKLEQVNFFTKLQISASHIENIWPDALS